MDLLVLFPLEFLANLPASAPAGNVETRATKVSTEKTSEEEEAREELEVKAKLRFEFTKIPALWNLKPN